jgi:deoxyribodipyrimidine photo-lyase
MPQVVWFKRDLRVHDHAPLAQAAALGPVVALHITEPSLLASDLFDASHQQFIDQSLSDLDRALADRGARLLRRWGEAVPVLDALHAATGFTHLWSHEETGQRLTWDRDRAVLAWCRARGVRWTELPQCGVFRPLASRNGWAARWDRRMAAPPLAAPAQIRPVPGLPIQTPPGLQPRHGMAKTLAQPGGEPAGRALLQTFLQARGVDYRRGMSSPLSAEQACSRLSPHLAWGTVSLRTVSHAADARAAELQLLRAEGAPVDARWSGAVQSFQGRLRWHCHFMQKLEDAPRIEFQNFARSCDGLRPDRGEPGWHEDWFQAWCAGRTGYPMVDACMRALLATGWINFRMRAMLVSFAAYHLWLHWRQPALFLARQFVDFEPGIHFSQCQMQSGTTGINTLRIYSPTQQARVQDPDGVFIRRWVPELAAVPAGFVHEPWRMPAGLQDRSGCRIVDGGRGDVAGSYPAPLVDHATAWRAARERFAAVRNNTAARLEADAIQHRHGSRKSGMRMTGQAAGPAASRRRAASAAAAPAQLSLFDGPADDAG